MYIYILVHGKKNSVHACKTISKQLLCVQYYLHPNFSENMNSFIVDFRGTQTLIHWPNI